MKPLITVIAICILAVGTAAVPQKTKYGVTATAKKDVDFSRFTTYSWTDGRPSMNKTIHSQVMASVDRELSNLGLTKADSGPVDVLATYASLTRTDVDVKAKPDAQGRRPEYSVGTLVVRLLDPASRTQLLELRVDQPVDTDPERLAAAIDSSVAALFAEYPTRRKK